MYLLDTNICIYAMKGHVGVLKKFRQFGQEALAISSLTMAELAYGVARSKRIKENTLALQRFHLSMNVLSWDDACMWHYGEQKQALKIAGTPIGEIDLLLGAQALGLGATLVSNNLSEFKRIQGLKVENWV